MVAHPNLTIQSERLAQESPELSLRRVRVAEYLQMITAGVFEGDSDLELLEGLIVAKMPKNPPHTTAVRLTLRALTDFLPSGWFAISQDPILTEDSAPEPDICVVRGRTEDYRTQHPNAAQIMLVIEVSDTTLRQDRTTKARIYAHAGIPEYWIINLTERQVEVHSTPDPALACYTQTSIFQASAEVPLKLPEHPTQTIPIRHVFTEN